MPQNSAREVTVSRALAMLVVNPVAAFRVLETGSLSSVGLDVPEKERDDFSSFLLRHGQAFRASVLLLRKRRMDNVLDVLSIVAKLFSEYELACYWDDYLASIPVGELRPKNPLLESIQFGRFLLGCFPPADPHSTLVAYDVARNEVLASIAADETSYDDIIHDEDHACWSPFLHPSAHAVEFQLKVGALVKMIASGIDRNKVLEAVVAQPETILFFKNWVRGGVGSLRINSAVNNVLVLLDGKYNAKELCDKAPAFRSLLKTLDAAGAIAHLAVQEK